MYYAVKLRWKQPKPNTDEMQTVSKQYLVNSLSCTEAELRVNKWTPANYQDAVVEEVKQTKISVVEVKGAAETFWLAKLVDDGDGRSKPITHLSVSNALNMEEAIKNIKAGWAFSEVEMIQKFKVIVDEDLISEEIKKVV